MADVDLEKGEFEFTPNKCTLAESSLNILFKILGIFSFLLILFAYQCLCTLLLSAIS